MKLPLSARGSQGEGFTQPLGQKYASQSTLSVAVIVHLFIQFKQVFDRPKLALLRDFLHSETRGALYEYLPQDKA